MGNKVKKKFKENELKELHEKLQNGWMKQQGDLDGFEETWQVVNDASKYSFNASHSLSYAYDSLYGAYLKAHYPIEYYTTTFNLYEDDAERTAKLTEELKYFGIELKQPKFRFAQSGYSMDKETNTIYKGLSSIKYLNEKVANELYELRNNQYDDLISLLIDLKNISINSRQLDILCKLDFFSELGKRQYLLDIIEIFNKLYSKKTFKKDSLPVSENIMRKFANKESDKQFREVDVLGLIKYIAKTIPNDDMEIKEIIKSELEFYGSTSYMNKELDKGTLIVTALDLKYSPKLRFLNPHTGNSETIKISKKIFKNNPLELGDMVMVYELVEKPKKTKVDGRWIETDQFEYWLNDYEIIN